MKNGDLEQVDDHETEMRSDPHPGVHSGLFEEYVRRKGGVRRMVCASVPDSMTGGWCDYSW